MAEALAKNASSLRALERDEVHYRARASKIGAKAVPLLVVNISAMGLMARSEMPWGIGDRLMITLPIVGAVAAEIRWALGGRIGFSFERPIDLADYIGVLAAMR